MKKGNLILVGGGGHCRSCIDVIEAQKAFKIHGILDVPAKVNQRILKYKVVGTDQEWAKFIKKGMFFLVALGRIDDARKRVLKFQELKDKGALFPVVVSPRAYVSPYARIGAGSIIMHNAVVNANAIIGENCIINTGAIVEHDVKVGDHCDISTASVVNGACCIGHNTFIGSNSVIKEGVSICDNVVVGAGSVVIKPIIQPGVYVGNPVRRLSSVVQKYVLRSASNSSGSASSRKKVILLTRTQKPFVKNVIQFLNEHFKTCIVYQGEFGDKFPDEILEDNADIIISYLSPWVVPKKVLEKTKGWNINFHPGPPEYPGIGCFNFAIYDQVKTYGATAHIMQEKVDTGKILAVKRFALSSSDSVQELSLKTYAQMFELFQETLQDILKNNKLPVSSEVWKREPYRRVQLDELCRIDDNMNQEEIKRRIKATTYPGKPGPYIQIEGHKFELNVRR